MKPLEKTVLCALVAFPALITAGHSAPVEVSPSAMTVVVFPVRLNTEISTGERRAGTVWTEREKEYDAAIRGAAGKLIRALERRGFRSAIEGTAPFIPAGQSDDRGARVTWPFVHAAIQAGGDAFLLCDITAMEYTDRTSHYLFEIYSVTTYRLAASIDARLVDARSEKIIKAVTVKDTATHRVHRIFWDTIWIHHYATGPALALKLMESAAEKIARAVR